MAMRLTSLQAAELTKGFHIEEGTMNLVQALYLNNETEPLNHEKVRQALCYAVNPEEIMMMIADGKGVRVGTSMYPGLKNITMRHFLRIMNRIMRKRKHC